MLEGFDDGLTTKRFTTANGVIDAAYGVHGNGMKVGDLGGTIHLATLTTDTTLTVGYAVNVVDGVGGDLILAFLNSMTSMTYHNFKIGYDESVNRLYGYDRTGTIYGTPNTFFQNTWYYVEAQVTFDQTNGAWEIRVDGDTILSATSRDTLYSSGDTSNNYLTFGYDTGDWVDIGYIDNIYLLDSTGTANTSFLGNIEVATLLPSGNGTTSTMTGSDANQVDNYLLVDNNAAAPPATTEYVGSATEGHKDTYAMDDLAGTPTVLGVVGAVYASKTDSGAKYMRPILRSGTTDYAGTSLALSDSTYGVLEEAYDVDPDTSAQWTYTGVNAVEFGQEVRDS
jgi:hypothetical protein